MAETGEIRGSWSNIYIYIYIYIYVDYREAHTGVVYELSRQYDRSIERKYYHPFHENIMTPEGIKYECKLKQ